MLLPVREEKKFGRGGAGGTLRLEAKKKKKLRQTERSSPHCLSISPTRPDLPPGCPQQQRNFRGLAPLVQNLSLTAIFQVVERPSGVSTAAGRGPWIWSLAGTLLGPTVKRTSNTPSEEFSCLILYVLSMPDPPPPAEGRFSSFQINRRWFVAPWTVESLYGTLSYVKHLDWI
ncbi:hypothetical protein GQ53DRAFT_158630 [Thozetella sp. PMI_491]|nr:hypothetical protein GQ53DRAFT_158630 [Thozetella sp. PMI_491]